MSKAGLLSTIAFQLGPHRDAAYALEGSIGIAGMALTWLRDQLGLIESVEEAEELAAQVPDSGTLLGFAACQPIHLLSASTSLRSYHPTPLSPVRAATATHTLLCSRRVLCSGVRRPACAALARRRARHPRRPVPVLR